MCKFLFKGVGGSLIVLLCVVFTRTNSSNFCVSFVGKQMTNKKKPEKTFNH